MLRNVTSDDPFQTAVIGPPSLDLSQAGAGTGFTTTFTENGSAPIAASDITITDTDPLMSGSRVVLTNAQAGDVLSVPDLSTFGLTSSVDTSVAGQVTVTISGSASIGTYQAALQQITFRNTGDDPSAVDRDVTVVVTDSGNSDSNVAHATIHVVPVNDPPTLTAFSTLPNFVEDGPAAHVFVFAHASTVEAGQTFTSMTLTVSNLEDDAHEILNFDGSDLALINGNSVASTANNGLAVSVSVGNTNFGTTATVTFSGANLSAAQLEALVDGMTYRDTSHTPSGIFLGGVNPRTFTITTLVDSGSNVNPNSNIAALHVTSTIDIIAANDTPVLTGVGPSVAANEQTAVLLDSNVSVSDLDLDPANNGAGAYNGTSLTIARHGGADGQDLFGFDTTGALFTVNGNNLLEADGRTLGTFSDAGGILTINFTGIGITTRALVDNVMDHITYTNTSDAPPSAVTLDYTFNDGSPGNDQGPPGGGVVGGPATTTASMVVNITPINDAPVNHLNGPVLALSSTDFPLTFFSVSDPDAGSGQLITTLSVTHGTLSINSDGGAAVAGSGSALVTLTGTLGQINTTLSAFDNVLYHSNANFFGSDTVTVTTNDNGNTGLGGPLTTTSSVSIQVETLPAGDGHFSVGNTGDFLLRNDDGSFRVDQVGSGGDNATTLGAVGKDLNFMGAGDFNGDGTSDFLMQSSINQVLGVDKVGSNLSVTFASLGAVGSDWHVAGIGDFNGDHTSDILWQRDDGTYRIYNFNNYQVVAAPILGSAGSDQHFVGIGDFNGDGTSDVLIRTDGGLLLADEFKNNQVFDQRLLAINANTYQVVGIGDFNGDHTSDILVQSNGFLFVDSVVNNQGIMQPLEPLASDTHVAGVIDFNHDGTADLLLRQDNGNFEVQTFHNGQASQPISLGQVGNEWHIV